MYNRYVPQADGSYCRHRIDTPQRPAPPRPEPSKPAPPPCAPESPRPRPEPPRCRRESHSGSVGSFLKQIFPNFDTEDLMIVLLLLLMAGDCREEQNFPLLTLALYLFL